MKREITSIVFSTVVIVAAAIACDDDKEGACKVDRDCPQGMICRQERCGPVGGDAATPSSDGAPACEIDGVACTNAEDCCSRACTAGHCGSAAPAPTNPTCRGLYELCQNDCCEGLTCTSGACR